MAISNSFTDLYTPIIRGICDAGGSVLISGNVEIHKDSIPGYDFKYLHDLFTYRGLEAVSVDFHDSQATLVHDLNFPLPDSFRNRFDFLIDIGTIEHVADTAAVFRNYISCLKLNGKIFLHTPCKGYFDHGFHTFSPEFITETLKVNGFDLNDVQYIGTNGKKVDLGETDWVIIQVEATKVSVVEFSLPQQSRWIK